MSEPRHNAIVTGASGDLGRAVVRRLLADGRHVLAQVHAHGLADVEAGTDKLHVVHADLLDGAGVERLMAAVPRSWHGLDVLVNCVGGARPAQFGDLDPADWTHCLTLNVTVPFLVMRATLPMLQNAGGSVVNLASVAAMTGGAFGAHYAAAKAAVVGLSRSAARDLGPAGIRVNVVAPGPVASRMTQSCRRPRSRRSWPRPRCAVWSSPTRWLTRSLGSSPPRRSPDRRSLWTVVGCSAERPR